MLARITNKLGPGVSHVFALSKWHNRNRMWCAELCFSLYTPHIYVYIYWSARWWWKCLQGLDRVEPIPRTCFARERDGSRVNITGQSAAKWHLINWISLSGIIYVRSLRLRCILERLTETSSSSYRRNYNIIYYVCGVDYFVFEKKLQFESFVWLTRSRDWRWLAGVTNSLYSSLIDRFDKSLRCRGYPNAIFKTTKYNRPQTKREISRFH